MIDIGADKTLTISGPDRTTQHFAWTSLDDLEPQFDSSAVAPAEPDRRIDATTATSDQPIEILRSTAVVRGDRDVYMVDLSDGQTMSVSITSLEDNAVFDIVSAAGQLLVSESTTFEISPAQTGEHQIVVGGVRGNATYDLMIHVR